MFSELPHRGDSNEYTQYTIFNIKKKIAQNYPKSAALDFFSKGLKNEFETSHQCSNHINSTVYGVGSGDNAAEAPY